MSKQRFSTKELEEILEVSDTTIRRARKTLNIEPETIKKMKYYTLEDAKKIILEVKTDFDFSKIPEFAVSTDEDESKDFSKSNSQNADSTDTDKSQQMPTITDNNSILTDINRANSDNSQLIATLNRHIESLEEKYKDQKELYESLLRTNEELTKQNGLYLLEHKQYREKIDSLESQLKALEDKSVVDSTETATINEPDIAESIDKPTTFMEKIRLKFKK